MRPDSITLAIFEKYSPEEFAETAQKLVQALADKETAENEKKVSDSVFKERINKHDADAAALAHQYSKGGETAQIGCTIRYDVPAVGKKSYIRMDREEVIEVHDMSLEEKQETLQFPLATTAAEEPHPKPKKNSKPGIPLTPTPESTITSELTFKDIQAIAVNVAKLPVEHRAVAVTEMQAKIATSLRIQKGAIGPDGRVEPIDSQEIADKLAEAWLALAIEKELMPPPAEEVTRICPYPNCILFADHDGDHDVRKSEAQKAEPTPEPQQQPERKAKRKKRGYAPPPKTDDPPAAEKGFQ